MNDALLISFKILIVAAGLITALGYGLLFGAYPIIAIGLLVAAVFLLIFYYKENWGIYLALFAIPFDRLSILAPGGALTVAKFAILTTIIVWSFRRITTKDNELFTSLFYNPLSILGLLFLFLSFTSGVNAQDKV